MTRSDAVTAPEGVQDPATKLFRAAPVEMHQTSTARVALRRFGSGPPIVFLHGWPLCGFTFRKLLPYLAPHFTCLVFDVPGGGETEWTAETDFTWPGQAATIKEVLDAIGIEAYFVYGEDSGAMIGRRLAMLDGERVDKMIMTNTEMPGHRPPWMRLYRLSMFIPGTNFIMRLLLRSRTFLRSRLGFGNAFHDLANLDGDFRAHVIAPLVRSARSMAGHNRFLRGWNWRVLDAMQEDHATIQMPVLLIWGEDDPTFPVEEAEQMVKQFPTAEIRRVKGAKVFVQEDQPEATARLVIEFLQRA